MNRIQNYALKTVAGILMAGSFSIGSASANNLDAVIEGIMSDRELIIVERGPSNIGDAVMLVLENGRELHISKDGNYLIAGPIYKIENGTLVDQSADRMAHLRIAKLESLDSSIAIKYEAVEEKHNIYIFTDVTCGYCKKFHAKELNKLLSNGISVNYIPYVAANYGRNYDLNDYVWCSDNPAETLTLAKNNKTGTLKTCKSKALRQGKEIGKMFGVRGTPNIAFANGDLVKGYKSAQYIINKLNNQ
ncbi:MAG: DsbC family protein [Pseudomonadales bacterium]|nr:DsbC family protein [Pseudomonadales bacterium]